MNNQTFFIKKPALFSFAQCLWFLDRGFDECLYRVTETDVTRALLVEGEVFLIRVSEDKDSLVVQVLKGGPNAAQLVWLIDYVTDWFDMVTNMQPYYKLLAANKKLAYMVEEFKGLRLIGIPDLFEALCWSIIGQQINLSFAYKLKRRMVEAYGQRVIFEGITYYLMPEPERLTQLTVPELRAMQFSDKKAEYIITVANAFAKGEVSKDILKALPTIETKQQALTKLRGIGIWTANYALKKSLKEQTSIPHGDIGILNALANHGIIKERTETEKINRFFNQFKGWESYLVAYLWRSLIKNKG